MHLEPEEKLTKYIHRANGNVELTVKQLLDTEDINRRFVIVSGEYGIGKTTLLNHLKDYISNRATISFDFGFGITPGTYFLTNAVIKFVESMGITYFFPKKSDVNIAKEITNLIATLLPSIGINETGISISFSNFAGYIKEKLSELTTKYSEALTDSGVRFENYIHITAKLTSGLIEILNEPLYVFIDDFDEIDLQTSSFINLLLESSIKICVVATSEVDAMHLENKNAETVILKLTEPRNDYDHEIPLFENKEIEDYLSHYSSIESLENLEKSIILAKKLSDGNPLCLSVLCEDKIFFSNGEDEILRINKAESLNRLFRKYIVGLTDDSKNIIYYLVANSGYIDSVIFRKLFNNGQYGPDIRKLKTSRIICEAEDNFHIRFRLLSAYIEQHDKDFHVLRNDILRNVYKEYLNCEANICANEADRYLCIVRLAYKLNQTKEIIYQSAITGCDWLFQYMKPDIAGKIISIALLKNGYNDLQMYNLMSRKLKAHYESSQLLDAIECYTKMLQILQSVAVDESLKDSMRLIAAKSYYYLNQPREAISIIDSMELANDKLFLEAKIVAISAYDLMGEYTKAFEQYDLTLKIATNKSEELKFRIESNIQLRSSSFSECVDTLNDVCMFYSNSYSREEACALNNLGIEYLMNGDFSKAKELLEKAKIIFEKKFPLELHFVLNNIGLLYQYSEEYQDFQIAEASFKKAAVLALSPLQNAYVRINYAVLKYKDQDFAKAESLFLEAYNFIETCPDPIAHSYYHYNYAKYLFELNKTCETNIDKQEETMNECKLSFDGISKPQLSVLHNKRIHLANELGLEYCELNATEYVSRRAFFSCQEWEPCELMFYN